MSNANIKGLYVYPLKSAKEVNLDKVIIEKTGFKLDRNLAVIDSENEIITARENPRLLLIDVFFEASIFQIKISNKEIISIDFNNLKKKNADVFLFKTKTKAQRILHEAEDSLSDFLNQKVRLIFIDPLALRTIKQEYNAKLDDKITFNDIAPIHLINEASVSELNSKLKEPVLNLRFRPNIILSGIEAYAEENWKCIKIGDCEFDVLTKTERCSLITINTNDAMKDPKQEPLRTLAKYKRGKKVNFGIYLVPRKLGNIRITDKVEILE